MDKRKIAVVYKNKVILLWNMDPIPAEALLAGMSSGGRWVEVDLNNKATLGWTFDGTNYNPPA